MSDSELSEASSDLAPSDRDLEKSLRQELTKAHKAGIEFSVNSIREASEQKLGLRKDYFRNHETWAKRSKDVIKDQMSTLPDDEALSMKPRDEPCKEGKPTIKKRRSVERQTAPRKKQKIAKEEHQSEGTSSPLSELDPDPPKPKSKSKPEKPSAKVLTTKSKPSKSNTKKAGRNISDEDNSSDEASASETHDKNVNNDVDSDSEMSVLLDEEPQPKKRRKETPQGRQKKPAATKANPDADADPDQAEIKRLQGWLVKCGIRKLWGKELKPYETPKSKIKHLKEMLADVGMTGRYSIEKANQIREARELAADIEAVQEGAERWGADEETKNQGQRASQGRPAKRLVRGAKHYDFLSSDGEETD
ncbi:uncharacterized protein PV06_10475 [Exophiala oligosperma]|uniref:Transcriptional regulator n=1 Tax=Exophiala oligosperma TaxID=215243 RepID=A0A0D2D531_9EURO|nr:uncharacterized protein PV06_10475 [Exophiala oligosperma]KIW37435.1 hypothetical protein PV06_10475 [Exophiala oligosperma]